MTGKLTNRRSILLGVALLVSVEASAQESYDLVLATTTSVRDTRLLDDLLPRFEAVTGISVRAVAVGSGQAMTLGRRGEADILMLHDPSGEEAFVEEGYGVERHPLMHNEFVIVGAPSDPAGIRGLKAAEALRAIARVGTGTGTRALFISRGDRSGTHVKEDTLWGRAGVTPSGAWHWESGQGMGATIQIASELGAYTLSDIGTFLSRKEPPHLEILVRGDSVLINPYHVILVNQRRFPWVKSESARVLSAFLRSEATQRRIADFRREELGQSLFVPDALTEVSRR
jgi:tungstate transport system substrate-binding protein